jgi:4-amino-4-deoxy-L-arabinose transferase-like glycosyltransferase
MFLLIMRLPTLETMSHWTLGGMLWRMLRPFEPIHFIKTCWYMRPLTAIFAAAAVALPWYWAVGLATDGAFLEGFIWEHNVGRATTSMEGHSGGLLWFYPVAILLGFFPWSCFALPLAMDAGVQARRRDGGSAGYVFAICWVAVYVGLFSLARTKLPSYVTPCYPALALLAGSYVDRWSRDGASIARWWLPLSFGTLAIVGVGFAAAIPLVAKRYLPGEEWLGLFGLTPLAGGVACIGLAAVRNYRAAAVTFSASAIAFITMLFAIGAQRADMHQMSHVVLRAALERSGDPQLASFRILEPSWVFYAGRPIVELPDGRSAPDDEPNAQSIVEFLNTHTEGSVIVTDRTLAVLASQLPPEIVVIAQTPRFLKEERLILLARADGSSSEIPLITGEHSSSLRR